MNDFDKIFGGVIVSRKRLGLDFSGDPDNDPNRVIFKGYIYRPT